DRRLVNPIAHGKEKKDPMDTTHNNLNRVDTYRCAGCGMSHQVATGRVLAQDGSELAFYSACPTTIAGLKQVRLRIYLDSNEATPADFEGGFFAVILSASEGTIVESFDSE